MTERERLLVLAIRQHVRDGSGPKQSGTYAKACLNAIEQECRMLLGLCQRCGESVADESKIMCTRCWVDTGDPVQVTDDMTDAVEFSMKGGR